MYSIVKRHRVRGVRKSEREIVADWGVQGELTLASCGPSYELKLSADDGSRQEPIIPILFDARLTSMHGAKMLFRGCERGPDGAEYIQEWSVLITFAMKG
jgi:hypothetical protein